MISELSGFNVLSSILATAAFVVTSIVCYRWYLAHLSKDTLEKSVDPSRPVSTRNKYPAADVFRHSGMFLRFGLTVGGFLCLVAFSYTEAGREILIPDDTGLGDFDETEVKRTAFVPPAAPPPPPPPPVIEPVPDDEIVEDIKFDDTPIDEPLPPPPPAAPKSPKPADVPYTPPAVAEVVSDVEDIFAIVEDMPRFPGCDGELDKDALKTCAEKKMLQYIYGNVNYPRIAIENGVEGKAIVAFVVERDGSITDVRVVRGPAAGISEEAQRVVNSFPKWIPGKQRGRPVRVSFTLPIDFTLK